jgi:hypothetical protein
MTEETIPKEIKKALIRQAKEQNSKGILGTPANLAATALSEEELKKIPGTLAHRQAQDAVDSSNATPLEPKKD